MALTLCIPATLNCISTIKKCFKKYTDTDCLQMVVQSRPYKIGPRVGYHGSVWLSQKSYIFSLGLERTYWLGFLMEE